VYTEPVGNVSIACVWAVPVEVVAHPESSDAQQTSDALSERLSIVLISLSACGSAVNVGGFFAITSIMKRPPAKM